MDFHSGHCRNCFRCPEFHCHHRLQELCLCRGFAFQVRFQLHDFGDDALLVGSACRDEDGDFVVLVVYGYGVVRQLGVQRVLDVGCWHKSFIFYWVNNSMGRGLRPVFCIDCGVIVAVHLLGIGGGGVVAAFGGVPVVTDDGGVVIGSEV